MRTDAISGSRCHSIQGLLCLPKDAFQLVPRYDLAKEVQNLNLAVSNWSLSRWIFNSCACERILRAPCAGSISHSQFHRRWHFKHSTVENLGRLQCWEWNKRHQ